jgi:TPR repeat protein
MDGVNGFVNGVPTVMAQSWGRRLGIIKMQLVYQGAKWVVVPARSGDGVRRDETVSLRWLGVASELGNAQAMFLLSDAYRFGSGVERDQARGLRLLEQAAEHEYPPALQDLALAVQGQDAQRASHLLKEASEHRRNNWNRY